MKPTTPAPPAAPPPPSPPRDRGLGDFIARNLKRAGIEPCGGCEERRDSLNRWFPFPSSPPPRSSSKR